MANHTYLTLPLAKSIGKGFGLIINQIKALGDWSSNSNYLLDSDQGNFILSIIEDQSLEEASSWCSLHGERRTKHQRFAVLHQCR